jgi:hypothetical protein
LIVAPFKHVGPDMNRFSSLLLAAATALVLSACTNEPAAVDEVAEADAFAARINARNSPAAPASGQPQGTGKPRVAEPLPNAAPGPFSPGTATDPASATCGANRMGPFIGKLADEATRREIVTLLGRSDNVRIVTFDTPGYINPNPQSPRLNLMLDAQGIIRDARCG